MTNTQNKKINSISVFIENDSMLTEVEMGNGIIIHIVKDSRHKEDSVNLRLASDYSKDSKARKRLIDLYTLLGGDDLDRTINFLEKTDYAGVLWIRQV